MPVYAEIWELDYFKYIKFDGDFQFFVLDLFASFFKKQFGFFMLID